MRNLKRALSLALASVMLLGMMVVGTSAASYADVSSKNNLEAIEVLKAVGVMTGDEKGNFNPDANVTRNEMAVIMTNLLGLTPGGNHPFTDVPAWAAPYVAACYNNDIIAGVSATQFNGDANVTAVQAGLMVMKALGYFGFAGEFGDNWKLSTVKQANKIDLYDGINAYTDQIMTRNEVAQLVLNALEADVVVAEEHGGFTVDGNGITVSQKPTYTYTPAKNNSNKGYDSKNDGDMQLCEKLYDNDLRKNGDATDDFGRPASEWTYHTTSIKCADEATLTYTKDVKVKDIYSDLGKPSNAFVQDTATKANAGKIVVDGQQGQQSWKTSNGTTTNADIAELKDNSFKVGSKGATTEVYYDKNSGEVNIIVINTYLAQATEDYDKDDDELTIEVKSTKNFETTLDGEDFALASYKDEDYLIVKAVVDSNNKYTVKEIAPATVVSDVKVSAYKVKDSVTAAGTKYEYNAKALADTATLGQDYMTDTTHYTLQDTTYDLYLDSNGYVIGVEAHSDETNLSDYLFVTDADKYGFEYQAKAQFMDGTTKTITVKKTSSVGGSMTKVDGLMTNAGAAITDGKLTMNRFYSFTVNKSGEYELTDLADTTRQTNKNQGIDSDAARANVVVGLSKAATSKTVFIADEKVYTGVKNAPDTNSSAVVYVLLDKDSKYILAAYTEAKGTNSSSASEYIYITSADKTVAKDEDDNTYYTFDAVIDGKKVKGGLKVSEDSYTKVTKAGLYEITGYTDGYADLDNVISGNVPNELEYWAYAKTVETKNGILSVTGAKTTNNYVLHDDVVIYSVDSTDSYAAKTVTESGVNSLKGTEFSVYLLQASKDDDSIVTVYIVRNK